jgi:hypothetical protein
MTVKVEGHGLHIFPHVENADANPANGAVEMILVTKVEGQSVPVVVKLTKGQASDLAKLLALAAS